MECDNCGGRIEMVRTKGRVHEYRPGHRLPVPEEFPIATCERCQESYLSVAEAELLHGLQKPLFLNWQRGHLAKVIRAIQDAHRVSLREIERVCGVTGTYLSHLLAGRKEASQPLINLLEALSLAPAEFSRKVAGTSWDEARLSVLSMQSQPAGIQPAITTSGGGACEFPTEGTLAAAQTPPLQQTYQQVQGLPTDDTAKDDAA